MFSSQLCQSQITIPNMFFPGWGTYKNPAVSSGYCNFSQHADLSSNPYELSPDYVKAMAVISLDMNSITRFFWIKQIHFQIGPATAITANLLIFQLERHKRRGTRLYIFQEIAELVPCSICITLLKVRIAMVLTLKSFSASSRWWYHI